MLSDAKAMCQQTDTHCECNTNANIIDHRVRKKLETQTHLIIHLLQLWMVTQQLLIGETPNVDVFSAPAVVHSTQILSAELLTI